MMKTLFATLFTGALLLTSACSTGAEGQEAPPTEPLSTPTAAPETTEAPEPTEEPSKPTEAELVDWVENREGFDQLKDEDPRDYLNEQALEVYSFFCRELRGTALPSEVFDKGLEMPIGANAAFGDTFSEVEYEPSLKVDATREMWDLDLRRPIQYEVATTLTCPSYAEAFETWDKPDRP